MGPAHGQAPPEAAQGVQRSQSAQVLSFTRTSADLFGSMADETAELAYLVGRMADETSSDWADKTAELAYLGGSMADKTSSDWVGSMADKTERSTAQGAGRMGPARGQAPPEATHGVQRSQSQSSQVLSFTRTSPDVFGRWTDETEEELAYGADANQFGLAKCSDWVSSMADETDNLGPNIPNPDQTETKLR
jgi:hypothetical protein